MLFYSTKIGDDIIEFGGNTPSDQGIRDYPYMMVKYKNEFLGIVSVPD